MSNMTSIWTADRGYAMPASACALVPSHLFGIGTGADLQADVRGSLAATPKFRTGPRTWSPPIT